MAASAAAPAPRSLGHPADWQDAVTRGFDRLLTSPQFRRWAARFPLTRPIARRRTRALFDLCAGFVYAQTLRACVSLGLFDILAEGPQPAAALAARMDLPQAGAERLLAAAVALRLVARRRGGRFGLGPLGAAMVDNPAVAAMVAHHDMLYADLADPVALLRGTAGATRLGQYWPYAGTDRPAALAPGQVTAYSALMAVSQQLIAAEVLDATRIDRHRCLLDLGGGEGGFLIAAAARAPGLGLMLFDLPAVADRARERFAAAGVTARAIGGDFRRDKLPDGADIITLIRVLHDQDDADAAAILRAAHRALPPGGVLLVGEPMAETPGAEPAGDAYFGFYLLAMGSGRPRSAARLSAMLAAAGFEHIRPIATATPLLLSILTARTPTTVPND